MAFRHCYFLLASLAIIAVSTNAAMVIHICKCGSSTNRANYMFKLIAVSNATYSICLCIQAALTKADVPLALVCFISTLTITSFHLQFGFNVSLALERYLFIANAVKYHSEEAKKRLEKRLSIVVFTLSFIIGINFSMLRFLLKNILFLTIPMAVSRIIGNISLCILYFKLYVAMKSQNQSIVGISPEQGAPPISNNEMMARRMKHVEHSKRFFIGITSTFFVLNLPMMILFFITSDSLPCNTMRGILALLCVCLSLFNMVFDSIWYFYMNRRSKRL